MLKGRRALILLTLLILLPGVLGSAGAGPVAPLADNDNFANAKPIAALPYDDEVDDRLSGVEEAEVRCGYGNSVSVWYRYDNNATEDVDILARVITGAAYYAFGTFSHSLAVYEGTALTPIGCRTDAATTSLGFSARAGRTYFIRLAGSSGGPLTFHAERTQAITGRLTSGIAPAAGTCVSAYNAQGTFVDSTTSQADGFYALAGLAPGTYRLKLGCTRYITEWHSNKSAMADADPVEVVALQGTSGIDADLVKKGAISGRVTVEGYSPGSSCTVWATTPTRYFTASTGGGGVYSIFVEQTADYVVRFVCSNELAYTEWWSDKTDASLADLIHVELGEDVTGIDADLSRFPVPVNDAFVSATPAAPPVVADLDMRRATIETDEPRTCEGTQYSRTVWHRVVMPANTRLLASLEGSGSAVAVFQSLLGAEPSFRELDLLRCSIAVAGSGHRAAVGFEAVAGRTYWIQLGTSYSLSGLRFRLGAEPSAKTEVTLDEATIPCATACPYWQETANLNAYRAACNPEPFAAPGTYQDVRVTVPQTLDGGVVPTGLLFEIRPVGDTDSFICATAPDLGGSYYVAVGANSVDDHCDVRPIGCPETVGARVQPGETYVLRIFNWSDWAPVPGSYSFLSVGT